LIQKFFSQGDTVNALARNMRFLERHAPEVAEKAREIISRFDIHPMDLFRLRIELVKRYRVLHDKELQPEMRKVLQDITDAFNRELNAQYYGKIQDVFKKDKNLKQLSEKERYQKYIKLQPFHWVMEYSEVFEQGGFHCVIGNPPYVVKNIKKLAIEAYKKAYKNIIFGRLNLYGLFIDRSNSLLNVNCWFGFINPKTFTTDKYFINFRNECIKKKYQIKEIILFLDRRKVFVGSGILQSVVILIMKKDASQYHYDVNVKLTLNADTFKQGKILSENIDTSRIFLGQNFGYSFYLYPSKFAYELFEHITQDYVTLLDISDGAKTGSIQWDLFKGHFIPDRQPNSYRLIWAENIQRYFIKESEKRKGKEWINIPKNFSTQPNVRQIAIATQRVTADEQPRRIIASLLVSHQDFNEAFMENHTNWISFYKNRGAPAAYILGILNSKLMDFIFRRLNSNTQVSAGELNNLPFPKINSNLNIYVETIQKSAEMLRIIYGNGKEQNHPFDLEILDYLIYELYFKEKLGTNLCDLISPYLVDIEDLPDDKKLEIIEKVVERIRSDEKIQKEIEKIKSHPWVKIIEEGA